MPAHPLMHLLKKSAPVFALVAALIFAGVAEAQTNTNTGTVVSEKPKPARAVQGGEFLSSAGVVGVQADANVRDFFVQGPRGTSGRYVDVFDKSIFIPIKSDQESDAFVQYISSSHARIDFVRPIYVIGVTDFAGGLSIANGSLATNLRGTPSGSTAFTVADIPKRRIDTSSTSAMTGFLDDRIHTRSASISMQRQDCRDINYPDGTHETVCAPRSWVETPVKRWTYHLNQRAIGDGDTAAVVISKLTTPTVLAKVNPTLGNPGYWTIDFASLGVAPSFAPPALRNCGGRANGDFWWEDIGTASSALACASGTITNPANPYRQEWTNQQQYQCYDGKIQNGAYPMTPTRVKPSSTVTAVLQPMVRRA